MPPAHKQSDYFQDLSISSIPSTEKFLCLRINLASGIYETSQQ